MPPMWPYLLLSALIGLFLSWLIAGQNQYGESNRFLLHGERVLKTSPPPEVSIDVTEDQLQALTEAYDRGFDHPNPNSNDPCDRLKLLPYKKLSAWRKQFRKRGFTMKKIKGMLQNGRREVFMHPEKATAYTKIYDAQGNWIVVDFVDCIIWQVAPYNFK